MRQDNRTWRVASAAVVALAVILLGTWAVWAQGPPAPRSTVTVYVNDEQFRPVRGATVTIAARGQTGGDVATYRQGVTDGTGVFKARNMAPGGYRVTAEYLALAQSKLINVAQDAEREVILNLVTTGTVVYGTVVDAAGRGVGGLQVTLSGDYPPLERQDVTSPAGAFALGPVPDGRFQVTASDPEGGYASAGRAVVVVQGWVSDPAPVITVAASSDLGAIRGRIISSEANSEVFRFEVTATDAAGLRQAKARLNRGETEFALSLLPPGVYRVALLRVNQYGSMREVGATAGVVVQAGETTEDVFVVDREP